MMYSGDMTPVVMVSGTTLNVGSEVVPTMTEIAVGKLLKPIFFVRAVPASAATGSVVVTYEARIAELPYISTVDVTITLGLAADGKYYGYVPITTDYSTIGITKIKNSTDVVLTTYEIGMTGMIYYY